MAYSINVPCSKKHLLTMVQKINLPWFKSKFGIVQYKICHGTKNNFFHGQNINYHGRNENNIPCAVFVAFSALLCFFALL